MLAVFAVILIIFGLAMGLIAISISVTKVIKAFNTGNWTNAEFSLYMLSSVICAIFSIILITYR